MSKYKSKKITVDGIAFDSKIEAKYYDKLKNDKALGSILNFELQPKFILQPKFTNCFGKNIRAIGYKADFRIYELDHSETIIDIKGLATPEAKLKRKMFMYTYSGEELLWIVWYGGIWQNYDDVQKQISKRKKDKLNEECKK
jgi:hypothetical protein